MPGRVAQPTIVTQLPILIPKIFEQAQISVATHQKNFVALYKIHTEAAEHTETVRNGKAVKLIGERRFEEEFQKMLLCAFGQKKSGSQADRVIKFAGGYTQFVNEKAAEEKAAAEEEEELEDDETSASRFTEHLLKFLLKGFKAKEKLVRQKVLHTVAEMVSHLGEVNEDLYTDLRSSLVERVTDKEASVRVQALIALSKLAGTEDPNELEEGEPTVLEILLDAMSFDSNTEVRKAALLNTPVNAVTLPRILERMRDTDTTIRKLVYHSVLEPKAMLEDQMGPTHPRALSIAQRELIVKNGLGDREASVRAAAASLIAAWVDAVTDHDSSEVPPKKEGEDAAPQPKEKERSEKGILALLALFDLTDTTVAADALLSVFASRVDIFENLQFDNEYWSEISPERAFLPRVFVDYCIATKDNVRLEAALPVVTALAFRIQDAYNNLVTGIQSYDEEKLLRDFSEDEKVRVVDERMDQEFILGELLALAVNLDYSDGHGRGKMSQLIRDMLSRDTLPTNLVSRCIDVMRALSAGERDLIQILSEIVSDLRDSSDEEEEEPALDADAESTYGATPATVKPKRTAVFGPKEPSTPEEKAHADAVDLRCLTMCISALEGLDSPMENNSSLDGIFKKLIEPSLHRTEPEFKHKALICLGLCFLVSKRLVRQNLRMIMQGIEEKSALRVHFIKIFFDNLMVHDDVFLREENLHAKMIEFLGTVLDRDTLESPEELALVCIGTTKLMIAGMVTDTSILESLVKLYLLPHTADNQELRQCLTFFFPVYSYSSPANQSRIQKSFIPMYLKLKEEREQLEDETEMIRCADIVALFSDWTDPEKLSKGPLKEDNKALTEAQSVQVHLAIDIVQELFKDTLQKDDKKVLCQLLPKLHLPEKVDDDTIKRLKLLMHNLRMRRPLRDTTTLNNFTKFENMILKKYEKQLEDFSEEEYRKFESLQSLFEFLDSIIPLDDDELIDPEPRKRGRKRRSQSVASTTTNEEGGTQFSGTPPASKKGKSRAKRPRLSAESDHSGTPDTERQSGTPSAPSAPKRNMPKRAATKKPAPDVIVISSDDDEEEPTPRPSRIREQPRGRVKQEEDEDESLVDQDIDQLLEDPTSGRTANSTAIISHDSIMDDSDEDEEDEVNDLLAED
ncbi:ARM repeat-containing protein [Pluteus cervinus]|uniref:ARM repeat-containing protein n=1 Tax=Pluteus cervinus TaxID=181527 RepID=A0ACD3AJF4_9AGAR|nr:ARM repeat-containing protein [Pluteus cervinus]